MCGKWHMGDDEKAQRGFTWWHTVPGGGGTYRDPEFVTNGKRRKLTGFKTDLVTDGALEFLDTVKDKPFFLLMPFYAPHTPYDYQPEEFRRLYDDSTFPCYPGRTDASEPERRSCQDARQARFQTRLLGADQRRWTTTWGASVKRLEELRLRENTLVIFTADQGWNAGHHGVWGKGNGTVAVQHVRGVAPRAADLEPCRTHPRRTGRQQPHGVELRLLPQHPRLPWACLRPPADGVPGRATLKLLREDAADWRSRMFFEYEFMRGVRTRNLKYMERTKEWPSELYDLEADPGEKNNLITDPAYQKALAGLRRDLGGFFTRAGAPPIEDWRSTTKQTLTVYQAASPRRMRMSIC